MNNVNIQPKMAEAHRLCQSIRAAASTGVRATEVPVDAQAAIKDLTVTTALMKTRIEKLEGIVEEIQNVFTV